MEGGATGLGYLRLSRLLRVRVPAPTGLVNPNPNPNQVQELLGEARAALEARSAEKRTREIEVVVAKLGTEMTLASKAAQARLGEP